MRVVENIRFTAVYSFLIKISSMNIGVKCVKRVSEWMKLLKLNLSTRCNNGINTRHD